MELQKPPLRDSRVIRGQDRKRRLVCRRERGLPCLLEKPSHDGEVAESRSCRSIVERASGGSPATDQPPRRDQVRIRVAPFRVRLLNPTRTPEPSAETCPLSAGDPTGPKVGAGSEQPKPGFEHEPSSFELSEHATEREVAQAGVADFGCHCDRVRPVR